MHLHRDRVGSEDTMLIKSMCEGPDHLKKRNQSNYIKNVHWYVSIFHDQIIMCCLTSFLPKGKMFKILSAVKC